MAARRSINSGGAGINRAVRMFSRVFGEPRVVAPALVFAERAGLGVDPRQRIAEGIGEEVGVSEGTA